MNAAMFRGGSVLPRTIIPVGRLAPWLPAALLLAALLLAATASHARQAGEPRSWSLPEVSTSAVRAAVELQAIDAAALRAEDLAQGRMDKDGQALRIAIARAYPATPTNAGYWRELADGGRLWQLPVRVPGATDLSIALSRFVLPDGATLHLFSTTERYYEGPYTRDDARDQHTFWSPVVPGPEAVIELYLPPGADAGWEIVLKQVHAGYRDLFGRHGGPLLNGEAGGCNIDVACPLGNAYDREIRSSGRLVMRGVAFCSGTLVIDAAASFRPWFLTAAHCMPGKQADADASVVYWNFERPGCNSGSGSLADNQAGGTLRAWRRDVDVSLIELAALPDPAWRLHYTGWDRSGVAPQGSIHIHHPSGDVKKISLNLDPLTKVDSCISSGGVDSHWLIDNYEQGTTEPGSSGSGVWTLAPQPRLVGFLSGGRASCFSMSEYDCYGRFDVAWDGATPATRLRDWLGGGLPNPPLLIDGQDAPPVFDDGFE